MFSATDVATCSGFLGSWLLVAGPMFQGALELHAEDLNRAALHRVANAVPAPPRISTWWWLLPPALYVLHWRNARRHRERMFAAMTSEQREKTVGYLNKATGWFMVSGGATLLAGQVTWGLVEQYSLPAWSFWVLVGVMLMGSTLNTTARMFRTERMVRRTQEPGTVAPSANPTSS